MKLKQLLAVISLLLLSIVANAQNTFPSTGNVGIGTTTPNFTAANRTVAEINGTSSSLLSFGIGGTGKGYIANFGTDQYITSVAGQVVIQANNTTALTIGSNQSAIFNGKVGIGNTSLEGLLTLEDADDAGLFIKSSGTAAGKGGYMFISNAGVIGRSGRLYGDVSSNLLITATGGSNNILFGTGSAYQERMRISSDGYVGIGTTTPSQKLSVIGNALIEGDITTKKVTVTQSGWPDYVFHPSYALKPLIEVAQFVKQNKHLPDVPSAKEVEEKGISLGDNQALLLKKIEELTLYLIEMNNKNERMQFELNELRKKVDK